MRRSPPDFHRIRRRASTRGRLRSVPLERELGGYEIVGRLAVGGMAEVYQARPLPTTTPAAGEGPEVVLKRLLPAYRNDGAHRAGGRLHFWLTILCIMWAVLEASRQITSGFSPIGSRNC